MSSRQRNRLCHNGKGGKPQVSMLDAVESEESDDSLDDAPVVNKAKVNAFQLDEESSTDDDEEASEEEDKIVAPVKKNNNSNSRNNKRNKKKEVKVPVKPNIDEALDEFLGTIAETTKNKEDSVSPALSSHVLLMHALFHIADISDCHVDKLLQKRFRHMASDTRKTNEIDMEGMDGASRNQLKRYKLAQKRGLLVHKGNTSSSSAALWKSMFCTTPTYFQRPPSITSGGYDMVGDDSFQRIVDDACSNGIPGVESYNGILPWEQPYYTHTSWVTYGWSAEYSQLQQRYHSVQATGDPNQLFEFISRYPHHTESLLQLSMVFARTGHMDKSAELIKRCMCNLEAAFMHGFEPWKAYSLDGTAAAGAADMPGLVRLAPRINAYNRENIILFQALFRHVQVITMLGCPAVALHVSLLLLSLDPLRDPSYVLLMLDHLLVTCRKYDWMEKWFLGVGEGVGGGNMTRLILGYPYTITAGKFAPALSGTSVPRNHPYFPPYPHAAGTDAVGSTAPAPLTLSDMPNWAYSYALLLYFKSNDTRHNGSSSSSSASTSTNTLLRQQASHALIQAVCRFPVVWVLLAEKLGVMNKPAPGQQWGRIFEHGLFMRVKEYLPDSGHVVYHLSDIYILRNTASWKQEDILQWVHDSLTRHLYPPQYASASSSSGSAGTEQGQVLAGTDISNMDLKVGQLRAYYAHLSTRRELTKYTQADGENFAPEFQQLPPDMNPLNPRLIDPRIPLFQPRALGGPGPGAGGRRQGLEGFGLEGLGEAELAMLQAQFDQFQLQAQGQGQGLGAPVPGQGVQADGRLGNLDLTAPLMQLFLQSLLPWNHPHPGHAAGDMDGIEDPTARDEALAQALQWEQDSDYSDGSGQEDEVWEDNDGGEEH